MKLTESNHYCTAKRLAEDKSYLGVSDTFYAAQVEATLALAEQTERLAEAQEQANRIAAFRYDYDLTLDNRKENL